MASKYLDKVLRNNSYEEPMWLFKQADSHSKEITESYAAFFNMKNNRIEKIVDIKDSNILSFINHVIIYQKCIL